MTIPAGGEHQKPIEYGSNNEPVSEKSKKGSGLKAKGSDMGNRWTVGTFIPGGDAIIKLAKGLGEKIREKFRTIKENRAELKERVQHLEKDHVTMNDTSKKSSNISKKVNNLLGLGKKDKPTEQQIFKNNINSDMRKGYINDKSNYIEKR